MKKIIPKITPDKIFTLILIIFAISYIFYKEYSKKQQIKNSRGITLCRINKYEKTGKGGRYFRYEYILNNKKYNASIQAGNKEKKYEKRYFLIEYSKKDPTVSEILFGNEILDTTLIKAYGFELNPPKHKNPLNYDLINYE